MFGAQLLQHLMGVRGRDRLVIGVRFMVVDRDEGEDGSLSFGAAVKLWNEASERTNAIRARRRYGSGSTQRLAFGPATECAQAGRKPDGA